MPTSLNANQVAEAFELTLIFAGLVVLWWVARRPQPPPALPKWEISPADFGSFIAYVILGGLFLQLLAVGLLRFFPAASADLQTIVAGTGFQLGMLAGGGGALLRPAMRADSARWTGGPFPAAAVPAPAAPTPAAPATSHPFFAGVVLFLVTIPAVTIVSLAWQNGLQAMGFNVEEQDLVDLFANSESVGLRMLLLVVAVVTAPVTEELVFRAGLFRYARGRLPRWAALLVPACLFAGLHANLASFAPLAALAILFSLAYERTGDIRVSMIAHALFNLNTAVLVLAGVTM